MPPTSDIHPDVDPSPYPSLYLEQRGSRQLEYVYQAAILVAILLLLWTVTA